MGKMISDVWRRKLAVFQPGAEENQSIEIDLVVRLGQRQSDDHICFENTCRKDKIYGPGLDGVPLPPEYYVAGGAWDGVPDVLHPALDIEAAAAKVQEQLPMNFCTDNSNLACSLVRATEYFS